VPLTEAASSAQRQRFGSATWISLRTLRTIHEVFTADTTEIIDAVSSTGLVSTVDRATGQPIQPALVSVGVSRETFSSLVLTELDPVECLKHLDAVVSPHPHDLDAVEPLRNYDSYVEQYRTIEGADAIADLDSRRDLLEYTPSDFE